MLVLGYDKVKVRPWKWVTTDTNMHDCAQGQTANIEAQRGRLLGSISDPPHGPLVVVLCTSLPNYMLDLSPAKSASRTCEQVLG